MGNKYLECECCGFLAVIPQKDNHDGLICPFCFRAKCDHGGKFIEIKKENFIKEAEIYPVKVEWTNIIEKLPSKDALYLVHIETLNKNSPYINTAWYDPSGFGWSLLPKSFIKSIAHWMPLPNPPNKI